MDPLSDLGGSSFFENLEFDLAQSFDPNDFLVSTDDIIGEGDPRPGLFDHDDRDANDDDVIEDADDAHPPRLSPMKFANGDPRDQYLDLLSFQANLDRQYSNLDQSRHAEALSLSAQLSGMFFIAESPWNQSYASAINTSALTCYRRNHFQITGTVYIPRIYSMLGQPGGDERIESVSAEVTARESFEDKTVQIVYVPPKHYHDHSGTMEDEPHPIRLDFEGNSNRHSDPCPFTFAWERLRFKKATAKNNRRAALQQHYVISIKIMATRKDQSKVLLCEATSTPIIVRGRSPISYQTSGPPSREVKPVAYQSVAQEIPREPQDDKTRLSNSNQQLSSATPIDSLHRHSPLPVGELRRDEGSTLSSSLSISPRDTYKKATTPIIQRQQDKYTPIPTSNASHELVVEESSTDRLSLDDSSTRPRLQTSPGPDESPTEYAELSYEYFPIPLDDWTVPVEAVYRPHSVHHKKVQNSERANLKRRYFIDTHRPR